MKTKKLRWTPIILLSSLLFLPGRAEAQAPTITSLSDTSGPVGTVVGVNGTNFGATQGASTVSLNGTSATSVGWSNTVIDVLVPSGATSGTFSVTVNGQNATSPTFTVTPLPSGWSDGDIGSVGLAGSGTFANGVFTVKGAGNGTFSTTADGINFLSQSLAGDGTIVARVVSMQGSSSAQAGVMIRETLNSGANHVYMFDYSSAIWMTERTTTGGTSSYQSYSTITLPYWVKLVRSGNTFNSYSSPDGVNWAQVGSSQTVTMATNVYIGLSVSSRNTTALATATFDNVSITSSSISAPAITSVSATTGAVGNQVVISGTGFGTVGLVTLNGSLVTMNVWSGTSISVTIPSGATSGPLTVSTAPSMNASNPVNFAVTTQPLPSSWLDQDLGLVGLGGSATFANETFTVKGAGQGTFSVTADGIHFVYQTLSGDGTIVARVISTQGGGSQEAGVMFRETLDPGANHAYAFEYSSQLWMTERTSTGGSSSYQTLGGGAAPYWVKLNRTGNTFTSYGSPDGINWVQLGSSQTVTMATNIYVGLAVTNRSTTTLATATFDNVEISSTSYPAPVISNVSATTGSVGSQVVITGTGFGASQGGSLVTLNDAPVTVEYWTNTSIVITIPTGATSGPLVVSVAPNFDNSNPILFTVTTQPLPVPWLDQDVGLVGVAGNGTYSTGTFSVQGAGQGTFSVTADGLHFVYQALSGDGTIVARVASLQSGSSGPQAGIMMRETLDSGARNAFAAWYQSWTYMIQRTSPGATSSYQSYSNVSLPYWLKLARSGNLFTGYSSPDGVNWTQMGSSLSITTATNIYVGLVTTSRTTLSLVTGTSDNVSVTAGTTPFVTGVSPDLGGFGSSVTISGSNFGSTQGTSTVSINGVQASVTSWSGTQIVATVPNTAPSGPGPVVVTVGSTQSNANINFNVINPVISSLSPPQAYTAGLVLVNGSGFGPSQGTSVVKFNGVLPNAYSSWSDTQIGTYVPGGSNLTGPVTVTVDGIVSNGVQFTLIEPLSITSMTPTIGPVGTSVTITGAGFGATQSNSKVNFWGAQTAAAITSWSDTEIVASVPAGISTGPVTVTVASKTVSGPWFNLTSSSTLTDSLGNTTNYNSQVIGGLWQLINEQGSGCSTCTSRGNITYTYDSYGNILTETDALGYVTTNTYDSSNNLLSVTKTVGGQNAVWSYTYNSFGEVLTATDPLGFVTSNTYDSHGNLLTVTTPSPDGGTTPGSVTTFTYDSNGELLTIKDPLNNVTTLAYTSAGLINTITDAQNNLTTYGYDAFGNRTSVKDANNNTTTFTYDSMNRLTKITYPDTTTTQFAYDYRGRRTSVTDQNGKVTQYAYDDADRLTSVTDAANNVTTYGYDTESNLTSIKDANNNTTSFTYDAFGRVTKTTFPSGYIETYGYDADNNLTNKTDRKNQQIAYTYDQSNRLTKKTYPDNTTVNYTYDLDARLTQVVDPTGTYQFTFDNMGRLTSATASYAFLTSRSFTTSYTYDKASNRTGFTDPESGSTTYAYDTLNRLQTLTPPTAYSTGSFGFSYDALSRRTQMTRPNNVSTLYAYDNLSRLQSVLHQLSGSTIDGATYTADNAGNRTAKTDQRTAVTTNYSYDNIYELLSAAQGGTTTESYTYDPVGNRLTSLGVANYTNNTSNELTSTSNATYTYDYNGNTTSKTDSTGTTNYTWDFENRLTSITLPGSGGTVSFKYDPFGRRIYKSSSSGTSIYAYNIDNVVEEANASGAVVARYAQNISVDEPLAMLRSSMTSYYHADGLRSITSLSNAAGALAQTYTFDSFGKQIASSGSLVNPFQYTAREFDSDTNLQFSRARYYDPQTGRFLSEDLLRFDGTEPNPSLYWYVRNNPTNVADPLGLWPTPTEPILIPPCWSCIGFGLGAGDMWNNYERMKERNFIGDDLYYHCMANCQATNRGSGGALAAKVISFVRTNIIGRLTEPDWPDDDKANKCGQQGGDCDKRCAHFIPPSSPGKPKFPGW